MPKLKQAIKFRTSLVYFSIGFLCTTPFTFTAARDVTFCGERIPVDNNFVASKLMNIIRQQIRYVNLPRLRSESRTYFPIIEYYLKVANMPDDLKYIPIIESGFRNATSKVGAQGFWQLMKPTAEEWGLKVNGSIDERNDIYKATIAALRELARNYKMIQRDHNISSWVLTAASYNYGTGNLYSHIRTQGKNYFAMNLNPETAVYVYKIIAIKELFEYPELYIKDFRYNVFSTAAAKLTEPLQNVENNDMSAFQNAEITMNEEAKATPDDARIEKIEKPTEATLEANSKEAFKKGAKLVGAQISGKYPNFKDGDAIIIILQENLQTFSGFQRKGTSIAGRGWIVDDRIHIDLGFNTNNVILYDNNSEQGIAPSSLRKGEQVILRVQN